jgi:hypothetical protein
VLTGEVVEVKSSAILFQLFSSPTSNDCQLACDLQSVCIGFVSTASGCTGVSDFDDVSGDTVELQGSKILKGNPQAFTSTFVMGMDTTDTTEQPSELPETTTVDFNSATVRVPHIGQQSVNLLVGSVSIGIIRASLQRCDGRGFNRNSLQQLFYIQRSHWHQLTAGIGRVRGAVQS